MLFLWGNLFDYLWNNTGCDIIAEIFVVTTTDINGTCLIDINTFDRLCWILMNTKGTRHIVYSTNRNETKGRFEATLGNTVNGFINGAVTPMQNTASNPRSQASFAKRVASPSPVVNLTSIVFKQGAQFPL